MRECITVCDRCFQPISGHTHYLKDGRDLCDPCWDAEERPDEHNPRRIVRVMT